MRAGKMNVGVSLLVVGTAALSALYLVPPAVVTDHHDSTTTLLVSPPRITVSAPVWGENGSHAAFELRWQASVPVALAIYATARPECNATDCGLAGQVTGWANSTNGSWRCPGGPAYPYYVTASSVDGRNGLLTISATGSADEPGSWPGVQTVIGSLAAGLVLAVGAVATFLGLFLRADTFRPPARPPPDRGEPYGEEPSPGNR